MSNDECKDAISTIKTLTLKIQAIQERNDTISKENKTKQDTYDSYQKDYEQKLLPEWEKKRQNELDRLRYERRKWNNCIDGNFGCTKTVVTDQWCVNDIGFGLSLIHI
jgi:FtsZ-binding cell division protein ZapB